MRSPKIMLTQQNLILFIELDQIVYCQADNCYTNIYLSDGKRIMVVQSLSKFSRQISSSQFIRVNQSFLINTTFLLSINKKEKYIELVTNTIIPYTIRLKALLTLINTQQSVCP